MAATDYLDFELEIERTSTGYRARVHRSPAGEREGPFVMPFSDLEVENILLRMAQFRRGMRRIDTPDIQLSKEFGGQLFRALFTEPIYNAFQTSRERAAAQGAGLRLRLRLAAAPELATLPWEFLYNPAENRFLALSTETPLVRRLPKPTELMPLAVSLPIRILALIASPKGLPPLATAQEWANLTQALADLQQQGRVEVERLEPPTLSALQRALRRGDYHVFHFIGHGGFDPGSQAGVIYLEDENGQPDIVAGDHLGTLLRDERSLRLAVLNACEGGRTSRDDPFAGVAQSLIQQDIPAVVAMQFAVSDEAAISGAHELYLALADGLPVDAALTEARKAIYGKGMGTEWATPVLYMTAPNGRLFDIAEGAPVKAEPTLPVTPAAQESEKKPPAVHEPEKRVRATPKQTRPLVLGLAAVLAVAFLAVALVTRGFGLFGGAGTLAAASPTPSATLSPTASPTHTPDSAGLATGTPLVVLDRYQTEPNPIAARETFTLSLRFCNQGKAAAQAAWAEMEPAIVPVDSGRMFIIGDLAAGACIDLVKRYVTEQDVAGRYRFELAGKYADARSTPFVINEYVNLAIASPPTATATSTKTPEPTVRIVTTIRPILTPQLIVTPRPSPTPTPYSSPRFGPINFCLAIDSTNRCIDPAINLSAKTTKFYISFEYRDIPLGSRFDRFWYYNGKEFKQASSTWDEKNWNSPTGVEYTFLENVNGFAAGTYRVELWIEGQLLQTGEATIGR